jgi:outer membrane murein-binding lipoprotein Lpp
VTTRTMTRRLVLGALVGGAVTLAGCSSSPSASSDKGPATSVAAPGASLSNNARADVSSHSCAQSPSGWVFEGTVKNPSHVERKFQIVVDFVSRTGSTVATTVVNVPEVAPGAAVDWSATGAKGKSGVSCVVRTAQSS